MKTLVFGSAGGIGQALCGQLVQQQHTVVAITRTDQNDSATVSALISMHAPDWIFNCAGKFGGNNIDYHTIFDNNVELNWQIFKHYLDRLDQTVQIVTIGSTAHAGGRKDYILYAASKAALHNMVQGVMENFVDTHINVGLIHPNRVDTPMITGLAKKPSMSPEQVAALMIALTSTMKNSTIRQIGLD